MNVVCNGLFTSGRCLATWFSWHFGFFGFAASGAAGAWGLNGVLAAPVPLVRTCGGARAIGPLIAMLATPNGHCQLLLALGTPPIPG